MSRLDVEDLLWIRVEDVSAIGSVRRAASRVAASLGFDPHRVGQVELAATELATNVVRHAVAGAVLVRTRGSTTSDGGASVELLVIDSGPGMQDVDARMRDGNSDTGTFGIGLGVIGRIANRLDIHSTPGRGTVTVASFGAKPRPNAGAPILDGITRAINGEAVCGDAWAGVATSERVAILVADGLGHGPLAAAASQLVVEEFVAHPFTGPEAVLRTAHAASSGTRGAAVSVVDVDLHAHQLRFAGVGNVAVRVIGYERSTSLAAQPGIVGQHLRAVREVVVPVESGALVVLHSDGLTAKWDLAAHRGLVVEPPTLIAAVLLREAGLRQDDATVVVFRVP
jgi:anti-sigma regulatory factor (Ser/Thr protein kinase)